MREQRKIRRNRQRIAFLLILFFCMAAFVAYHAVKPLSTEAVDQPFTVVTVVVLKGDSLWKIADRYDNNKMDLRQYINIIESYNRLDTAVLQPGQRLNIPVY